MEMNRRKFLTIAGVTVAIGFTGKVAIKALAGAEEPQIDRGLVGKRWAMAIDLKKCEGCAAPCITACHINHNVPKIDSKKEEIKWIWQEPFEHAFVEQENKMLPEAINTKPTILLCNHCDNPPCVSVCPTKATWKREDGIVMMDWHRCIGCRYCMAACPYGSRSFNWRDPRPLIEEKTADFPTRTRGVVEKCTFCAEKLVLGEMPLCVSACKQEGNGAMTFGDLEESDSELRKVLASTYTIRRKPELGTHPEIYYIV